jgi:phosphoglycerate dehydrogenase-like enzyme
MASITANAEMLTVLQQATGPVDVRDADGKVIAYLTPVATARTRHLARAVAAFKAGRDDYDPSTDGEDAAEVAEIERQMTLHVKGYTLAEVFEHLKGLTREPEWREYLQNKIDRLKERDRCDTR